MVSFSALNTPAALLRTGATADPELAVGQQGSTLNLAVGDPASVQLGSGNDTDAELGTRPTPSDMVAGAIVHTQARASSEWRGTHPYGRLPDVTLFVDGEEVDTDVVATTSTYLIQWPQPTTGFAIIR